MADSGRTKTSSSRFSRRCWKLYTDREAGDDENRVITRAAKLESRRVIEQVRGFIERVPAAAAPYFVLILRAFGTLEGLGLSTDENYAIVDQCFPYIARRLLSDDSPRMRSVEIVHLRGIGPITYGFRVRSISSGFSQFTNSMGTAEMNASMTGANIDPATKDVVRLLFNENGNYLQELVADEAVRAADSLSRQSATATWRALATLSPVIAASSLLSGAILIPA